MSNIIDKKLFEQIFGHTLETLVNKVINTKKKNELLTILTKIKKNLTNKIKRVILIQAIKLILVFNETI